MASKTLIRFDLDAIIKEQEKSCYRFQNTTVNKEDLKPVQKDEPCTACGSTDIYYTHASTTCRSCGTVLEEELPEQRPGWRIFAEEDKKKIHAEKTSIEHGLTTVITSPYKDFAGKSLTPEMKYRMSHLIRVDNSRKIFKDERALRQASNRIRLLCGRLRLTDNVRDASILFFKHFVKQQFGNNLKGKVIANLAFTSVYKACKDARVPFKMEEISKLMKIDPKKIRGNYITIMQTMDRKHRKISPPVDYVQRMGSALKMDNASIMTMHKILVDMANHPGFKIVSMGKESIGYSAAAAYIACIMHGLMPLRNRETVAMLTNVAESTIKKRAEEIISLLHIDLVSCFNKHYKRYAIQHVNRFKKDDDED
jgi:transcription initiation factor TFIIB